MLNPICYPEGTNTCQICINLRSDLSKNYGYVETSEQTNSDSKNFVLYIKLISILINIQSYKL